MSYHALRHFADSYGLILLGLVFITMIGWTFRPGAARHHARAATRLFDEEQGDGCAARRQGHGDQHRRP